MSRPARLDERGEWLLRSIAARLASRAVCLSPLVLAASLAASCTVTNAPTLDVATPGYQTGGAPSLATVLTQAEAELAAQAAADQATAAPSASGDDSAPSVAADGDAALPEAVASLPAQNPSAAAQTAGAEPAPMTATAVRPTAFVENGPGPTAAAQPAKSGFLSSLFSAPSAEAADPKPVVSLEQKPAPQAEAAPPAAAPAPLVKLASTGPAAGETKRLFSDDPLPGVRQGSLFEITRKSGIDDDSDIDLHEDEPAMRVASAAGLARLAPNGLLKQNESVDVACLKPSLVRVLKNVEQHFGKRLIITSGYRDPERNRRARGARNSLHMYCAAADVQMPGVSKWALATYVRSLPGRGGVGTYCHTESIHIDVGPERDWNWRCRKSRS
jgi:uncharacterized protein YcbK (DUF882 family)